MNVSAIYLVIGIPFVLAGAVYALRGRLRAATQGQILAAALAGLCSLLLLYLPQISAGERLSGQIPWVPHIGLNFAVYLDGLALLFAILVAGIASAVMFYAGYYFEDGEEAGHFLALMMAFTGSMLAVVLAGNVLTLFIAWEGTSIVSFLLISFKGSDEKARAGASQALVITGGGGLALFLGLLLIGGAAGTTDLGQILTSGDLLRDHPWYTAIAILVMIGCFAKSAQFPLHFWLPDAMTAPTPASAFLHSATMVKAGVYLLARLYPVLGDTPLWEGVLLAIGLITMLWGAALALRQRDLKGSLAFATISQLGAFVALIGLPHAEGIKAAMVGILAHALYKCALFLVVGAVEHATGTRYIDQLGELRGKLPGFAAVTGIACLSMAGVPPLLGFVAKEGMLEAFEHGASTAALVIVTVSAALTVALAAILFWDVFVKKREDEAGHAHFHELPHLMVYGPGALAALSIITGLGVGPLLTPLVQAVVGAPIKLYIFAPELINLPFVLSMGALAAGGAIFALRSRWRAVRLPALPGGPQIYGALIGGIERTADFLLRSQTGRIRYYLFVILVAVSLLLAASRLTTLRELQTLAPVIESAADVLKLVLLALAIAAILISILFKRHLVAALALGVAGYCVGGVFLLEPAPDVALVQFLVETLGTVLIIMAFAKTSEADRRRLNDLIYKSRPGLIRDIAISAVVGLGVTLFALAAVNSRPTPGVVSQWHLANSLPQVGAKDVVAAIVTDFRGMDTLIEITVFGIAALGVLTLLATPETDVVTRFLIRPLRIRLLRRRAAGGERRVSQEVVAVSPLPENVPSTPDPPHFSNPLTRTIAQVVFPFALIIAIAQILYGSSAPGDGFTAGVIGGLAIALWYIVFGYEEARRRLRWLRSARLIGFGLGLALLNAALPLLLGGDFLATSIAKTLSLPAGLKLSSTVIFEFAIFLTVLGGASAIMEAITHPKEVEAL